jgi:hypothetical protein
MKKNYQGDEAMQHKLSDAAMRKIDELVDRVAKKAGYGGAGEQDFKYGFSLDGLGEQIERSIEQAFHQKGHRRHIHKSGRKHYGGRRDFAEEIRTYLADGILDLMEEGHSEEEALKMTMDKFDDAEMKEDFSALLETFDGFGIQEGTQEIASWYIRNGEVMGLLYGFFFLFGVVVGGFLGYLLGDWVSAAIGAGFGAAFGIVFGLLSHALLRLYKR